MGGLISKKRLVEFSFEKKKVKFYIKTVPFWAEGFGLMFTSKKKAKALLFSYGFSTKMSIFSSFIPFDFLALWIDKEDKLIEMKIVKPGDGQIVPQRKFKTLIEVPMTEDYERVIKFFLDNKGKNMLFSSGKV